MEGYEVFSPPETVVAQKNKSQKPNPEKREGSEVSAEVSRWIKATGDAMANINGMQTGGYFFMPRELIAQGLRSKPFVKDGNWIHFRVGTRSDLFLSCNGSMNEDPVFVSHLEKKDAEKEWVQRFVPEARMADAMRLHSSALGFGFENQLDKKREVVPTGQWSVIPPPIGMKEYSYYKPEKPEGILWAKMRNEIGILSSLLLCERVPGLGDVWRYPLRKEWEAFVSESKGTALLSDKDRLGTLENDVFDISAYPYQPLLPLMRSARIPVQISLSKFPGKQKPVRAMAYKDARGEEWWIAARYSEEGYRNIAIVNRSHPWINTLMDLPSNPSREQRSGLRSRFEETMARALADAAHEQKTLANLASFDLPKNGVKIGWIPFMPNEAYFDDPFNDEMPRAQGAVELLKNKGYDISITNPDSIAGIYDFPDKSPEDNIIATFDYRIRSAQERGVEDFVLDISSHGTKDGTLDFSGKSLGRNMKLVMPASVLLDIAKKFPKARFLVMIDGCFGGRMQMIFEKAKLPNATFVFQSKDTINYSTFERFLLVGIHLIGSGKTVRFPDGTSLIIETVGQALIYADKMTRLHDCTDAEFILKGGERIGSLRKDGRLHTKPSSSVLNYLS